MKIFTYLAFLLSLIAAIFAKPHHQQSTAASRAKATGVNKSAVARQNKKNRNAKKARAAAKPRNPTQRQRTNARKKAAKHLF